MTAFALVTSTGADGLSEAPTRTDRPPAVQVPGDVVAGPATIRATVEPDRTVRVVPVASLRAIPSAALGAYRRAAEVLSEADPSCRLDWELVAAIGRVESDHGRHGGSTLGRAGTAKPNIIGPALNGRGSLSTVVDTDAGRYDGDRRYDRAVGPMQFLPETWSIVGVDGDGDGTRDPQNIHDAALAAAVYLCSGDGSLKTASGRRAALLRYNPSSLYVRQVLRVMTAYESGDYSAVPDRTTSAPELEPVRTMRTRRDREPRRDDTPDRPGKKDDGDAPAPKPVETGFGVDPVYDVGEGPVGDVEDPGEEPAPEEKGENEQGDETPATTENEQDAKDNAKNENGGKEKTGDKDGTGGTDKGHKSEPTADPSPEEGETELDDACLTTEDEADTGLPDPTAEPTEDGNDTGDEDTAAEDEDSETDEEEECPDPCVTPEDEDAPDDEVDEESAAPTAEPDPEDGETEEPVCEVPEDAASPVDTLTE